MIEQTDAEQLTEETGKDGRTLTHLWDWIDIVPNLFITIFLFLLLSFAALFLSGGGVDLDTGAAIEGNPFLLLVYSLLATMLAMVIPYFGINALRHRYSLSQLGFGSVSRGWILLAIVLGVAGTLVRFGIGAGLLWLFPSLEAGAEQLAEMFNFDEAWKMTIVGLMASLVVPVYEEIFFRGFLQNSLCRRISMWIVTIVCSALFGAIIARTASDLSLEAIDADNVMALFSELSIGLLLGAAGGALICGTIQFSLKDRSAMWLAILASSAIFGLFHGFPIQIITAFLFGLIVGWLYEKSDNLWPSIICHITNNGLVMVLSLIAFFLGFE